MEVVVDSEAVAEQSFDEKDDSIIGARLLNNSCETEGSDSSIHAFNVVSSSNLTVIEKRNPCEGSDSGVESGEIISYQRALSCNSTASTGVQSCDSSIISCCSNYDEAYNLLVRRNSTLIGDDYEGVRRSGDGTSENGSESSSVTGSSSSRNSKRNTVTSVTKKVSLVDSKKVNKSNKPPVNPRLHLTSINKSKNLITTDRTKKQAPKTLALPKVKENSKRPNSGSSTRASSVTRTPSAVTPTDDGRWPSVNSKPAPLMSRSLRGMLDNPPKKTTITQNDTKIIEKYATLPRRRRDNDELLKKSREDSMSRLAQPKKTISLRETTTPVSIRGAAPSHFYSSTRSRRPKVKIYHEANVQTALTMSDVDRAFSGLCVSPMSPCDAEKCDRNVQVDLSLHDIEILQCKLSKLQEQHDHLTAESQLQTDRLLETEAKLREEIVEKEGLREELKVNSQRVLAILGENSHCENERPSSSDSLMVLEARFQNVSQIVIRQEEEISKLNSFCRSLQIDLEKSLNAQKILTQQQRDLENESFELQDFMQAEKSTLAEALREAEQEMTKTNQVLALKDQEMRDKDDEIKRISKINEQRWQDNVSLQARLVTVEAKSRELLVHQGGSVSGTVVALSALKDRLRGLVDELVDSYEISDQDVEDVIFHNEAYSNSSSSPDGTPENSRKLSSPSPKSGSSLMAAVFNAIRNAAAQTPFSGHNNKAETPTTTNSEQPSPGELLDSETEPCLMMEHVLEDVVIPDGHSHNMISSSHNVMLNSQIDHSESLKDISQIMRSTRFTEYGNYCTSLTASFANSNETPSLSDILPSFSLVDQVIDVDNLVTKLLKIIQILQIASDDRMGELEYERDDLFEQIGKQKDDNKRVGKQLKDWEVLGARLKTECKEVMQQLSRKNNEIDNLKSELNNQREQVEKLNQDVCELSTALAKAEHKMRSREEEAIKMQNGAGDPHGEISELREKLAEKERHLSELTQEFLTSRKILTESLQDAVNEAKKQYDAIDNALEVLHSNQNVVQQCTPLAELQRQLENTSFQSASAMPLAPPADYNANAALMKAIATTA